MKWRIYGIRHGESNGASGWRRRGSNDASACSPSGRLAYRRQRTDSRAILRPADGPGNFRRPSHRRDTGLVCQYAGLDSGRTGAAACKRVWCRTTTSTATGLISACRLAELANTFYKSINELRESVCRLRICDPPRRGTRE